MKKILALVLALTLVLASCVFAFAEDTLPKADVSIINLESGDTVALYKIVGWDSANSDWAITSGLGIEGNPTVKQIVDALNATGTDAENASDMVAKIATAAVNNGTALNPGGSVSGTTFTYNGEVGMYLALITTSSTNVYNPMILSVNFVNGTDEDGKSTVSAEGGTIDADTAAIGTTAVAKKKPVTLTKEVAESGAGDVTAEDDYKKSIAVGDEIPFIVTTETPNYGKNYTQPKFELTDTLSTGLTMTSAQQAAILVKNGDITLSAKENAEDTVYDYEIETSASGYVIKFSTAYLTKVKPNTTVTVSYTAKVTDDAVVNNVTRYTNDVELEFSNSPTTTNDSLKDKTNHYTFSIDANLAGGSSGEDITKELIKVGIEPDGTVVTAWNTKEEHQWATGTAPLQGATFTLTRSDGKVYEATSDPNGYLTFTGLDAATYTLVETSAPAGYKFSKDGIPVVISATYWGANNEGHDADELKEYSIKINNTNTSTYSVINDGGHTVTTTLTEGVTTPINNEKGTVLPSTGGIGTTIFYILGGLLVIGAAVILVARRKAQD